MTDITIYAADGTVLTTAPVTSGCEWEQKLMTTDKVTLSWEEDDIQLIPMGSYIVNPLNAQRYYLLEPYYPQTKQAGEYEYKPEFQHEVMMLSKIPFLLYTYAEDGSVSTIESDWNFTGSGQDLARTLAAAIKEGIGTAYTIHISDEIEAALSLSFTNTDILSAINSMAEAWDVEWWTTEQVNGASGAKAIYFGKMCLHNGSDDEGAVTLEAGRHIESPSSNEKGTFYNRFYVFGSTKNIPQSYEGAQANHVVNKRLTLNPARFPKGYIDLPKFDANGNAYRDANGNYILDDSVANTGRRFSKVLQFEDIYPKSNCRIKYNSLRSVQRYVRDGNDQKIELADGSYDSWRIYAFQLEYYDDTDKAWKDFRLNKSTYDEKTNPTGSIIKGLTLSLHFSSGALEGREFEATYHDANKTLTSEDGSSSVTLTDGYFEVVHTEDNTIIIPNVGIAPKAATSSSAHNGDEVIVFNIQMPKEYYNVAYEELEKKAIEQIWEDTRDGNEYSVKSNCVYFADNDPVLTLGRHVSLLMGGRTIDTRVTALTTKLDRRYEQTISLSKGIHKGTINTLLTTVESTRKDVTNVSVRDERAVKAAKQRLYAAQREMFDAMFDADGNFTEPISPLAIKTALLQVGSTSQNFQLAGIVFEANYNDGVTGYFPNNFRVVATSGKMVHYGIDVDSDTPHEWSFASQDLSSSLTSDASVYYLYARCPQAGKSGSFVLTVEQIKYNAKVTAEGMYYFLIGVLSSVKGNADSGRYRILNTTYGATTVSGGLITTGRISSADGSTWFDLDNGEISGNIRLSASQDNKSYIDGLLGYSSTTKSLTETANAAKSTASAASSAASSAQATANAANSAASTANSTANAAKDKVDNISVGGRNLCLGTATPVKLTSSTTAQFGPTFGRVSQFLVSRNLAAGDKITISFVVTAAAAVTFTGGQWLVLGGSLWRTLGYFALGTFTAGQKKKLSATFTYTTGQAEKAVASGDSFLLGSNAVNAAVALTFSEFKVELGTLPTSWTPAPEDVDSAVDAAKSTANTAKSTADTAKSTADAAKNAIDNFAVGTRNLILGSQKGRKLSVYGDNQIYTWALADGVANLTFSNANHYAWLSYYVDDWAESYAPTVGGWNLGCTSTLTSGWQWWNGGAQLGWGYIQVSATTRRYWFKAKSAGYKLLRFGLYTNATQNPAEKPTIYNVMLSIGSALSDFSPAPEETDYLREALTEAAGAATEVTGGLILSRAMSVKDASGVMVAGLNGTDSAKAGQLPMIWAGAKGNTTEQMRAAAFRVYDGGHVDMTDVSIAQAGQNSLGLSVKNASLTLGEMADGVIKKPLTEIVPQKYDTITKSLESRSTQTVSGASAAYNLTPQLTGEGYSWVGTLEKELCAISTGAGSGTLTLTVTKASAAASCSASGKVQNLLTDGDLSNPKYTSPSCGTAFASIAVWVTVNGEKTQKLLGNNQTTIDPEKTNVSASTSNKTATANVSEAISATTAYKIQFAPGDRIGLRCETTVRFTRKSAFKSITFEKSVSASVTCSYTSVSEAYNNLYYANGLLLSSSNKKYLAANASSTAGDILHIRSGDTRLAFKEGAGLVLSYDGGARYYKANPLVMIVRMVMDTVNRKISSCVAVYNPLNKSLTCSRTAVGSYSIAHNLGNASHSTVGIARGFEGGKTLALSVQSITANTDTFTTADDNTNNDFAEVYLHFYDYKTY